MNGSFGKFVNQIPFSRQGYDLVWIKSNKYTVELSFSEACLFLTLSLWTFCHIPLYHVYLQQISCQDSVGVFVTFHYIMCICSKYPVKTLWTFCDIPLYHVHLQQISCQDIAVYLMPRVVITVVLMFSWLFDVASCCFGLLYFSLL